MVEKRVHGIIDTPSGVVSHNLDLTNVMVLHRRLGWIMDICMAKIHIHPTSAMCCTVQTVRSSLSIPVSSICCSKR